MVDRLFIAGKKKARLQITRVARQIGRMTAQERVSRVAMSKH